MSQFEIMRLVPLLGKGGARGGSINSPNNSVRRLTEPPLTPPLPRRGTRRITTDSPYCAAGIILTSTVSFDDSTILTGAPFWSNNRTRSES